MSSLFFFSFISSLCSRYLLLDREMIFITKELITILFLSFNWRSTNCKFRYRFSLVAKSRLSIFSLSVCSPWRFSQLPEFSRVRLIATGDTRFFHSRMHPRPRYVVTIRTLICVSSRSAYPRSGVLFYCVLLRISNLSRTFFRNFLITDAQS